MCEQGKPNPVEGILNMLRGINESPEFFDLLAGMLKKLHQALIKAGFTDDQATQIVTGFAAKHGK
jgi:hypothetical protein